MIDHLDGNIDKITPTYTVIDCNGIGYLANISLHTFSKIKELKKVKLLTHLSIREDAHVLFGFAEEHERDVFRHLITVSGVGSNTARMILSSLTPSDTEMAILAGDVLTLKKVKGIGAKTAERIIIDLKDKVGKSGSTEVSWSGTTTISHTQEATLALVALGFNKAAIEKAMQKVQSELSKDSKVEDQIKCALKYL
jgi:Holliday junction DNA helicase RuvA